MFVGTYEQNLFNLQVLSRYLKEVESSKVKNTKK